MPLSSKPLSVVLPVKRDDIPPAANTRIIENGSNDLAPRRDRLDRRRLIKLVLPPPLMSCGLRPAALDARAAVYQFGNPLAQSRPGRSPPAW